MKGCRSAEGATAASFLQMVSMEGAASNLSELYNKEKQPWKVIMFIVCKKKPQKLILFPSQHKWSVSLIYDFII